MELLPNSKIENMSVQERLEYYKKIKEECLLMRDNQLSIGQNIIKYVYPSLRGYKIEIEGEENIPKDSNVLFLVNHSNSHDIFTAYEVLSKLNRRGSVMVATDCLTPITAGIFYVSNATLLDRRKKEDRSSSVLNLSKKILQGGDGVIFGESTWNIHPILPMHNIKQGVSKISAITSVPVIPTIFEYIEEDGMLEKENKLYKKCLIRFGKPIMVNYSDTLINQTNSMRDEMIKIRKQIWEDYDIFRDSISDVDPFVYTNHTYLKKFKAFGFTYDSKKEQEYILYLNGESKENEYTITPEGIFCPGITEKDSILRKSLFK